MNIIRKFKHNLYKSIASKIIASVFVTIIFSCAFCYAVYAEITGKGEAGNYVETGTTGSCADKNQGAFDSVSGLRITLLDESGNKISGTKTIDFYKAGNIGGYTPDYSSGTGCSKIALFKGQTSCGQPDIIRDSDMPEFMDPIDFQNNQEIIKIIFNYIEANSYTVLKKYINLAGYSCVNSGITNNGNCTLDKMNHTYISVEPMASFGRQFSTAYEMKEIGTSCYLKGLWGRFASFMTPKGTYLGVNVSDKVSESNNGFYGAIHWNWKGTETLSSNGMMIYRVSDLVDTKYGKLRVKKTKSDGGVIKDSNVTFSISCGDKKYTVVGTDKDGYTQYTPLEIPIGTTCHVYETKSPDGYVVSKYGNEGQIHKTIKIDNIQNEISFINYTAIPACIIDAQYINSHFEGAKRKYELFDIYNNLYKNLNNLLDFSLNNPIEQCKQKETSPISDSSCENTTEVKPNITISEPGSPNSYFSQNNSRVIRDNEGNKIAYCYLGINADIEYFSTKPLVKAGTQVWKQFNDSLINIITETQTMTCYSLTTAFITTDYTNNIIKPKIKSQFENSKYFLKKTEGSNKKYQFSELETDYSEIEFSSIETTESNNIEYYYYEWQLKKETLIKYSDDFQWQYIKPSGNETNSCDDNEQCTIATYGVLTSLNDSGTKHVEIILETDGIKNKNSLPATCEYSVENPGNVTKHIYSDSNLQFRVIGTTNPFPGKDGSGRNTGNNWCEILGDTPQCGLLNHEQCVNEFNSKFTYFKEYDNKKVNYGCNFNNKTVKSYITNRNNSDNKENKEPLFSITLTSSDIKNIKSYNTNTNYDDYDLTCNEEGKECVSEFVTKLFVGGILDKTKASGTCFGDSNRSYCVGGAS